jgi:hypothetical protein
MAKQKVSIAPHKYDHKVEENIASIVVDNEFRTAESNMDTLNSEYETYVDLFESERPEKDYDWQSDVSLPEFASQMLTMSAIDANQYFSTRDFVDVYLQDESETAKRRADAAKELVNRTLNQKHLHWYQKYIRSKLISYLNSNAIIECWWEQTFKEGVKKELQAVQLDVDIMGNPITDPENQIPELEIYEREIPVNVLATDRFNCDVIDPRNVFMDNRFTYDLQDKDFVTIRSEKTLHGLKMDAFRGGYFNLEALEEALTNELETETARETYNKKEPQQRPSKTPMQPITVLKRYGKFWSIVTKRDAEGQPLEIKPGTDVDGEPMEKAELIETIITFALAGTSKILIGFNATPYIDSEGNPYRPLVRGLCYIHPVDDHGAGDGKNARELQMAMDDTFNLNNDRVRLATMPTFKGRKDALADNDSIYWEPNHLIQTENPDDIVEMKIDDNTTGALNTLSMLKSALQQVTALTPSAQGQLSSFASTSATATATAEVRTDMRTNYKSTTFENTALVSLYWMIMQMTHRFAYDETGFKLMGDKLFDFSPNEDYYYKPVTSTIESEQSKNVKIQRYTAILQTIAGLQHPDAVTLINDALSRIYKLMGDEFANYGDKLLDEDTPVMGAGTQAPAGETPMSNQFGMAQSPAEITTREGLS